jgi:topoisomerase-4 subunit B
VYIAQPPLFKVERSGKKKEVKYAWSQGELEAILDKWSRKSVVQRFKGLGEMDPDQLWETTMCPTTRTLVRVTIEDSATAERQVHILMGNQADLRKKWISENVRFGDDSEHELADEVESEQLDEAALESDELESESIFTVVGDAPELPA